MFVCDGRRENLKERKTEKERNSSPFYSSDTELSCLFSL